LLPANALAMGIVTCTTPPLTVGCETDGVRMALNVPVPPVIRKSKLLSTPAVQLCEAGLMTSAPGAGAAVPTTLLAVGGVSSVRPAASVIANVSPVKQVPFVVIVNEPPLRCTGAPVMVIAVGKFVPIV